MRTVFTVVIPGQSPEEFDDLEKAVRHWDRYGKTSNGGIEVKSWIGNLMVRDGWILHVEDGAAYLNPNIQIGAHA